VSVDRRGRRRGVPCTTLAVVGVVLALLMTGPDAAGRPAPTAAPRLVAAEASTLNMGVTIFAMWRDWLYKDQLLAKAKESGSPWVRVDMGWCSLEEAGAGQISTWYQDRLDATVAAARAQGLKLLVNFGCTPAWAGGVGYNSWPTNAAQVTRITLYLAQRYKGRVAAWEIWNEPDCIGGCPNGSPEQFVKVLRAGYQGIKAGDRNAIVVSGGISGNNAEWISRMYAAGARGSFDALAVHPYQDPPTAAPDAACEDRIYRFTCLPLIRDQMVRNGDAAKPIWLTEFGWTTAQTGERPGVDEATQAVFLSQSVDLLRNYAPYVTHAFWFTLRDRDDSTPYENEFGLLHVDGSEKPAFTALKRVNGVSGAARD
jgi:polysaccharide biosynthesis protein PslG